MVGDWWQRATSCESDWNVEAGYASLPECFIYIDALDEGLQDLAELLGLQGGIVRYPLGRKCFSPGGSMPLSGIMMR